MIFWTDLLPSPKLIRQLISQFQIGVILASNRSRGTVHRNKFQMMQFQNNCIVQCLNFRNIYIGLICSKKKKLVLLMSTSQHSEIFLWGGVPVIKLRTLCLSCRCWTTGLYPYPMIELLIGKCQQNGTMWWQLLIIKPKIKYVLMSYAVTIMSLKTQHWPVVMFHLFLNMWHSLVVKKK